MLLQKKYGVTCDGLEMMEQIDKLANAQYCSQSWTQDVHTYRRFNAIVSQLKMHYFSEGAFESLIASQLLKKEKYI